MFPRFPGGLGPSGLVHYQSVLHDPRQLFFAFFFFLKISGFKVFQSMHSHLQKSSIVLGELQLNSRMNRMEAGLFLQSMGFLAPSH